MKISRGLNEKAGAPGREPSEAATLVCAVSLAVALGAACGVWINARLASAASAAFTTRPAPSHLMSVAPAGRTAPTAPPVAEAASANSEGTDLAADVDTAAHNSDEVAEARGTRPQEPGSRVRGRPGGSPLTSAAGETGRSGKPSVGGGAEVKPKAGQGRVTPCAPYASAGSLIIRDGGGAGLVVGGPGERASVSVTTPDWADIAVFSEGPAGRNGWVKYSVKSVSKRPGVYAVRLTTPCGSQNIPVTVVR